MLRSHTKGMSFSQPPCGLNSFQDEYLSLKLAST